VEAVVEMSKDLDITDASWAERTLRPELEAALHQVPHDSQHLAIEFSVLDAAVERYLRLRLPGSLEVERKILTTGSVIYRLHHDVLGPLGTVSLRKLDDKVTEFSVEHPPRPRLAPETREESKYLFRPEDDPGTEEQDETYRQASKQRKKEQEAHHRWRRAQQAALILNLFQHLNQEQGWVSQAKEVTHSNDDIPSQKTRPRGRPRKDMYDEGYRIYYRNNHDAHVAFDAIKQRYPEEGSLDFERFRQAMIYRAATRGRRKRRKM